MLAGVCKGRSRGLVAGGVQVTSTLFVEGLQKASGRTDVMRW